MSDQRQLTLADVLPSQISAQSYDIPLTALPDRPGLEPDAELKASVLRLKTVMQPIIVQCDGPLFNPLSGWADSSRLKIIDGTRRVKAARYANLETIPARVVQMDGSGAAITLMMNAQRSDNPIHELAEIESLVKFGADLKLIASATGMPLGTIRKRLKLQSLILPLRLALDQGKVAVSVAERIAGLTPGQQSELAATFKTNGKLTSADVSAIKKVKQGETAEQLPANLFDFGDGESTPNRSESELANRILQLIDGSDPDAPGAAVKLLSWIRDICRESVSGAF